MFCSELLGPPRQLVIQKSSIISRHLLQYYDSQSRFATTLNSELLKSKKEVTYLRN